MKSVIFPVAFRSALIYIVLSTLWILLSDTLLNISFAAPRWHNALELAKGWGFAAASGILLYVILQRSLHERAQASQELEHYARHQEALAKLRQLALSEASTADLLAETVVLVSLTLDVEFSSVLELQPDGQTLVLRAGVGWNKRLGIGWDEQLVGHMTVPASPDSIAGHALQCSSPLIIKDLRVDPRFPLAAHLTDYGIISSMNMNITGRDRPFGVLGAHSDRQRTFSHDEQRFVEDVANLLATAVTRQQAEAEIRRQKTLLECQSEASLDGIVVLDPDGRIISYNQRFVDMWNIPARVMETLSGDMVLQFLSNATRTPQHFMKRIQYLHEHGTARSRVDVLLTNSRIFEHYSAPIQDSEGTWHGRVFYFRDITEFRQTRDALQESEEMFRNLVNSMGDIIFTLDREQRHSGVFGRWLERYGLTADMFLGKTSRETTPDEATAAIHEAASARALDGEYVVYEWSIAGSPGHFQTSLSPIHNAQGEITGVVGVGRDITALKAAEEALRQSHKLLEKVLAGLNEAVLVVNPYTRLVQVCNRTTEVMFGYTRDELIGHETDFLHVNQAMFEEFGKTALLSYQTHGFFATEYQMRRKNGEIFPTEHFLVPLYDDNNELLNVVSVVRDITERKRAEAELKRHNQQLAALNHIMEAINLARDLPAILSTLQKLLVEHLHIAAGAILLYHEQDACLSLESHWGLPPAAVAAFTRLSTATAHNAYVVREQKPLLLQDIPTESAYLDSILNSEQRSWKSYLGVPILSQGQLHGIMDLFSAPPAAFTTNHTVFLRRLVNNSVR